MTETKTYSYKLCVVGDSGVGKTSLIRRYADKKFDDSYLPTIGADFTIKRVEIEPGHFATLQIWDMGGQQMFQAIRNHYFMGANAALIIFDLGRKETFKNVDEWYSDIETRCGKIPIIILANKNDLETQAITSSEVDKIASRLNVKVFRTSAKTGENVEKMFDLISKACYSFYDTEK